MTRDNSKLRYRGNRVVPFVPRPSGLGEPLKRRQSGKLGSILGSGLDHFVRWVGLINTLGLDHFVRWKLGLGSTSLGSLDHFVRWMAIISRRRWG